MKKTQDAQALVAEFAGFVKAHHLRDFTAENLRLNYELKSPLMQLFSHLPEGELFEMSLVGSEKFLTDLKEGKVLETQQETLRLWEADQLPGLPRDAVMPSDLVRVTAAQRRALMSYLRDFTQDVDQVLTLVETLEDLYTTTQDQSLQMFTKLREEAAQKAVRLELEKEAAEAHAEELQITNEELTSLYEDLQTANEETTAQAEELQSQQEELNQLYEELQQHSDRLEDEVERRTEELREANAQLHETDRYKDEFLSVISHELRTPLNFITGFASLLEDEVAGDLNETQHTYVQRILSGTDRMLYLVNDLLDFARLKAGQFNLEPAPTAFGPLVDEVLAAMSPLADQKGIQLSADVEVPVELELDGPRILQVLTNLVSNGVKFTGTQGHVRVRAFLDHDDVVAEVADDGMGISQDDIPKLFERFRQLNMTKTREAGGAGLGLAISKSIIEAHGGTIGVRSTPGKGSVFWFRLPVSGTVEAPQTPVARS